MLLARPVNVQSPLRLSIRITLIPVGRFRSAFSFPEPYKPTQMPPAPVVMVSDVHAGYRSIQLNKLQSLLREDVGSSKQFPLFAFLRSLASGGMGNKIVSSQLRISTERPWR